MATATVDEFQYKIKTGFQYRLKLSIVIAEYLHKYNNSIYYFHNKTFANTQLQNYVISITPTTLSINNPRDGGKRIYTDKITSIYDCLNTLVDMTDPNKYIINAYGELEDINKDMNKLTLETNGLFGDISV